MRRGWALLLIVAVGAAGCGGNGTEPPVAGETTDTEAVDEPNETTEAEAVDEPDDEYADQLAFATERIESAPCWQKLNDRVVWTSDYIEYDLESTEDGRFIEDRLEVVAQELAGCDPAAILGELDMPDPCPRLEDLVSDLDDAAAVAADNPDHDWAPELSQMVEQERDVIAEQAANAGCSVS